MLVDRYGRPLKSLRVSVTSRCNFSCIYCHNEGFAKSLVTELSVEQYDIVARACRILGIENVKLTGGEPLIRNDIVEIVKVFSDNVKEVSMTTNGYYLEELANRLASAGLKRVCISVPSLNKALYSEITGVNGLEKVLRGIKAAYEADLTPITFNVVVLKWFNLNELLEMINLASKYEAKIRLIELEPIGIPIETFSKLHKPLDEFIEFLNVKAVRKYIRELHARPVYVLDNGIEVEIVSWFGNAKFCRYCDRVRLSPDGKIKPCIARKDYVDLLECLSLKSDEAIECTIEKFKLANNLREPFYKY